MRYQRPIFHDDGYGKYLLGVGPRYINVHENWVGEYYFSPAFMSLPLANAARRTDRHDNPGRYRIVVKLKKPPESAAE